MTAQVLCFTHSLFAPLVDSCYQEGWCHCCQGRGTIRWGQARWVIGNAYAFFWWSSTWTYDPLCFLVCSCCLNRLPKRMLLVSWYNCYIHCIASQFTQTLFILKSAAKEAAANKADSGKLFKNNNSISIGLCAFRLTTFISTVLPILSCCHCC